VPKYRRPVFTNEMLTFCQTTMRVVCDELGVELVEFNREADHVLLVQYPPALAISTHVQRLKGRTAYAVRREYTGTCVRARMRGHLRSPSYFAVSRGGAPLSGHQANTSTAKHGHFECRAAPGDRRDGLTPA
jgi:putative transposase